MESVNVFFLASSACAAVVIFCALTAHMRDIAWERTPEGVRNYMVWTVVFFIFGCLTEIGL